MDTLTYVIVFCAVAGVVGAIYLVLRTTGSAWLKFRGTRVVTCPETKKPAAVQVEAGHAAWTSFSGPDLRVKHCSHWPGTLAAAPARELRNCGEACLSQIEAAPRDYLVRTIVTDWYQGKTCLYCGKPLGKINLERHALLDLEGVTVEWRDLQPETIPGVLTTHRPVCWNCHIAETFRRLYPELVVDRDRTPVGDAAGSRKPVSGRK